MKDKYEHFRLLLSHPKYIEKVERAAEKQDMTFEEVFPHMIEMYEKLLELRGKGYTKIFVANEEGEFGELCTKGWGK